MIKEDNYKKITGIQVTVIFDDGDYVTEGIGIDNEFVADLYSNIRVLGTRSYVVDAMTYLLNLGSKAITGINPKDYVNGIKTHFGDTRNINEWRQTFPISNKEKEHNGMYMVDEYMIHLANNDINHTKVRERLRNENKRKS